MGFSLKDDGRKLAAFYLFFISIFLVGCGGGGDSSTFTDPGRPGAEKTNLRFSFTRATPQFVVPSGGTRLEFKFFAQRNQQGAELFTSTLDFASQVEVVGVPIQSQSFLIIVRDAAGLPLAEIKSDLTAEELAGGVVDSTGLINSVTLKTVTLTPPTATVALNGTQQYSLRGQFSNGETLTLAATFASSRPEVASVTREAGLATGLTNGRAVITATFQQVDYNAELLVDAKAPPLALTIFVSGIGDVISFFSTTTPSSGTFLTAGITGSFVVDKLGTVFHSSQGGSVVTRLQDRAGDSFSLTNDRFLDQSAFFNGITLAERRGVLIGLDDSQPLLYVVGVGGTLVKGINLSDLPRGLAYDDASDRLFVCFQSGRIGVFDNFLPAALTEDLIGILEPNRVFSTSSLNNPDEIAYDAGSDTLLVSDKGIFTGNDPGNKDGKIFLLSNASTATGLLTPQAVISGPDTQLADVFDIDLQGSELRVLEANKLLLFSNVFLANGNVAPDSVLPSTGALQLAGKVEQPLPPDATDIVDPATVKGVVILSGGSDVLRFSPDLSTQQDTFDIASSMNFVNSIAIDAYGDAFIPAAGGDVVQVSRLANGSRDQDNLSMFLDNLDRRIITFSGLLTGVDLVDSRGVVLIGDEAAKVTCLSKNGDLAPVFESQFPAGVRDIDYEPSTDDIYATLRDGSIVIVRDFLANRPTMVLPDVTLRVPGRTSPAGIVYDAANDVLLVSDDGAGGHVYLINNVSSLPSGNVNSNLEIGGPSTKLTSPQDIAFDGQNLYVSDLIGGLIRFDNIRSSSGGDVSPSGQVDVTFPGHLSLVGGF